MRQRAGVAANIPVFEFRCRVGGADVDMVVTSVAGHLMELDFESSYGWGRVEPVQLFEAPVVKTVPAV